MLKKFVSSILCVLMLVGCGATSAGSAVSAEKEAEQIVSELGLSDKIKKVEDRIIKGLFFFDEGNGGRRAGLYRPNQSTDLVGVFKTSDPAAGKSKVNDYLTSLKETAQMYNPEEAFKIDHAIIKEASDQVVVDRHKILKRRKKIADSVLN